MLDIHGLTSTIGRGNNQKDILSDISLLYPSAHLSAIIGPSGCGKSTLLKAIAGLTSVTQGEIFWDGRDVEKEEDIHPWEIGYIPQFSIAFEPLTIRESVHYAHRLRVKNMSSADRRATVESILIQVGLNEISNRQVKFLSGGQKRRLALALELVTSPALLLADEVTSGLDPKAEDEILKLLRKIADQDDRLVLTVIHSLEHLEIFDSITVLTEGKLAYHGPTKYLTHYFDVETPNDVFSRLDIKSPEEWHNSWNKHRLTYYTAPDMKLSQSREELEVLFTPKKEEPPSSTESEKSSEPADSSDAIDSRKSTKSKDKDRAASSLTSDLSGSFTSVLPPSESKSSDAATKEISSTSSEKNDTSALSADEKDSDSSPPTTPSRIPGVISQFFTLLSRRLTIFRRDKTQLWLQLALIIGFPCLVVIFALDGIPAIQNPVISIPDNLGDQKRLMEQTARFFTDSSQVGSLVSGLIMFQVILLTLMGANNSAREIAGERPIFEKEKLGGLRSESYVLSKYAYLFIPVAIQSVWMTFFVKFICGFPGPFETQLLLLFLVNAALTSICLGISSMVSSPEHASLISVYFVGFQLPLSGAVLALPTMIADLVRPFISSYWSWSGMLKTIEATRSYDFAKIVSDTTLSPLEMCIWMLGCHIFAGVILAWLGSQRSQWN